MGRFVDISGRTFGKLLVQRRVGAVSGVPTWLVRCDCGVEKILRRTELYTTKSCGCLHRRNDLVGKGFGKLKVNSWASVNKTGNSLWNCTCECGTTVVVVGHQLTSGGTKSCGCLRKVGQARAAASIRLSYGRAARNSVLKGYKTKATKRGLVWTLSEEEFDKITEALCFFCNSAPSNCCSPAKTYGEFRYNGIDRISNSEGYTLTNVVSCCWMCNWMKRNLSVPAFLEHTAKIHETNLSKLTSKIPTEASLS
jgi:hypothetical protein